MTDATREDADPAAPARPLDHRVVTLWTVQGLAAALVATLVVLGAEVWARLAGLRPPWPPGLPAAAVALAGGALSWWLARADYRRWHYRLAADALELRHGVVRRVHSAIPYFRVQHIDVTQGPVERALGLSRLVVHTASAATDATIPGIAAGDAETLRRVILARTGTGDAV